MLGGRDNHYTTETKVNKVENYPRIIEKKNFKLSISIKKKLVTKLHTTSSKYTKQSIKCVHDGHAGGPKQYNDFPLGNIFYFYANIFYYFSPPTWLPCTHSVTTQAEEN